MAFTVAPSPGLAGFIVVISALTCALVVAIPLPRWAAAGAAAWTLALCCHALAQQLRHREVRITGGTSITVDGVAGAIVSGSFVAPWLTIIHWRRHGSRLTRTLAVLPGTVDRARFRELRVILRWAPPRV